MLSVPYILRWMLISLCWLVGFAQSYAEPNINLTVTKVKIPAVQPGTEDFYYYAENLLSLALAQTEQEYGPVILVADQGFASQQQQLENLTSGAADVTWSVTSQERELQHIAIRIPLTGGLFGYRVFMIRPNESRFNADIAPDKLKQLIAVQGRDWPDTSILRHNGFKVIAEDYPHTFELLRNGTADYFPRAAHEIFSELDAHTDDNFVIAPNVVLCYQNPMFYFVSIHKAELAKRLAKGLQILADNGDLARLLTSQHFYIKARDLITHRNIYHLENPLLSANTKQALAIYTSPLQRVFK